MPKYMPLVHWMSMSTHTLDAFRARYSPRPPIARPTDTPTQSIPLQTSDGLRLLTPAPASGIQFGAPSTARWRSRSNTYLWVIDIRGIPYVFEVPIRVIGGTLPKHSNLTGGCEAHLGGELWFASECSLYLSGGSGRYPPLDAAQLKDATEVFESFGYEVTSLGWDYEIDEAKRSLGDGTSWT